MSGSPTIASLFQQRVVVGVGDLAVSNNTAAVISTYALGSCVGMLAYDPVIPCGGLIHIMLPESKLSAEKARAQPAMFADTGIPLFLQSLLGLRAERSRLRIYLAGGAAVLTGSDMFNIGERNTVATLRLCQQLGLRVVRQDLGGFNNRTVHLSIATGEVTVKTPGGTQTLRLA